MKPVAYITTSWDDGHPLDLRVAELLTKYSLPGTFYIPKASEYGTMSSDQLRELSNAFEIGAHTINHVALTGVTNDIARKEIIDSKSWLEDNTGVPCRVFCPPRGRYSGRHLDLIQKAGFVGVRSVELLSLSYPRPKTGLLLMPTTIHAHAQGVRAYTRNAVKRGALANLWRYIAHGRSTDWVELAKSMVRQACKHGGVFHLWGHSWELQKYGQWQRLEEVMRFMSQFATNTAGLTNLQLCQVVQSRDDSTDATVRNVAATCGSLKREFDPILGLSR